MASFVKFYSFTKDLADGVFDLDADTLKVALTNTAPTVATDDEFGDITEISAGTGYTAGGTAVANTATSSASGVAKLVGDDVVFTASGGSIGPFRYAVLYDDTASNDELIGYWDYGAAVTLADAEAFTVDLDGTNGILDIT